MIDLRHQRNKGQSVGVFVPEILCKCFRTSNCIQQDRIGFNINLTA